jgi:hypothetical protein
VVPDGAIQRTPSDDALLVEIAGSADTPSSALLYENFGHVYAGALAVDGLELGAALARGTATAVAARLSINAEATSANRRIPTGTAYPEPMCIARLLVEAALRRA